MNIFIKRWTQMKNIIIDILLNKAGWFYINITFNKTSALNYVLKFYI